MRFSSSRRGWSSCCCNSWNGARRCPARCGSSMCRRCGACCSHWAARRGGALTVLESLEADALASSLPPGHTLNALVAAPRRCLAAGSWEWDGVRFEFVHPASLEKTTRRNNQSCVLRVASNGGSMLLTGDIERLAESQIVQTNKFLGTDVLLVPHHGSRTSSSAELIQAVAPRWAVVPVGYRNRFGHPSREVLERYRAAGAEILRTDLDGAVLVRLAAARIGVQ